MKLIYRNICLYKFFGRHRIRECDREPSPVTPECYTACRLEPFFCIAFGEPEDCQGGIITLLLDLHTAKHSDNDIVCIRAYRGSPRQHPGIVHLRLVEVVRHMGRLRPVAVFDVVRELRVGSDPLVIVVDLHDLLCVTYIDVFTAISVRYGVKVLLQRCMAVRVNLPVVFP